MSETKIFAYFRRSTAAFMVALLAACAGGPGGAQPDTAAPRSQKTTYLQAGYACCNLRYEGDQIKDSNLGQLPFIAAGTPVRVKTIDDHVAQVDIDGRPMRLVLDNRGAETIQHWLARIIVGEDPRARLAAYPPAVRDAVRAGKLAKGMTREQVIMAVGYPQTSDKLPLDGPHWRYWWSGFSPYYVYWSRDKVSRIDGQGEVVGNVIFKGR